MDKVVYLDNAATTPVDSAVFEEMKPYFSQRYGNPMTAGHSSAGVEAREAVEKARSEVAALIGAKPEQIAFTSGGTESDNWAIKGALERASRARSLPKAQVLASAFEHAAVLGSVEAMRRQGYEASFARVGRDGIVDPDDLRRAMRSDTVLVSVMHANNEIGTIQPIAEIARIAHERGALLHVDAVQTAGHVAVDVEALGADFLSLSAHKFGGPKGVGALFVRATGSLYPFLDGGGQEWGMRGSTHDVPGIVGLGAAARLAMQRLGGEPKRLGALRDRLYEGLAARAGRIKANGDMRRALAAEPQHPYRGDRQPAPPPGHERGRGHRLGLLGLLGRRGRLARTDRYRPRPRRGSLVAAPLPRFDDDGRGYRVRDGGDLGPDSPPALLVRGLSRRGTRAEGGMRWRSWTMISKA